MYIYFGFKISLKIQFKRILWLLKINIPNFKTLEINSKVDIFNSYPWLLGRRLARPLILSITFLEPHMTRVCINRIIYIEFL